jgi:di/tricarboxylate transporter
MSKTVRHTGGLFFLVLGLAVGLTQMFQPALDNRGHLTLMMLIITIGLWIFKPFNLPFSVSGGLFMAALLAFGVPAGNVFSGFSGTAVWSLIPALFFGFALAKTGLGKRIAYFGMKSINVSYPGLLMMWTVIGIVLSMADTINHRQGGHRHSHCTPMRADMSAA